jgi:hypothetical protein
MIVGREQIFSTTPLPNTRTALYGLSIRAPDPSQTEIASYTFPISPSAISKEIMAMTNYYDIQGTPAQGGVQRIADFYGDSPTTFILQGTTGWQYHATDGGTFTGFDSILAVQALLAQYAQLNQQQAQSQQPLYTLEFYDYFAEDFWQVVPMGRQGIRQSATRPLVFEYQFRLIGIRSLSAVPLAAASDPIAQDFSTPASEAQSTVSASISMTLSGYASLTPGAAAVQP